MLEEFAAVAEGLSFAAPRIPVVSNLTGELVGEELCSAVIGCVTCARPCASLDGVRCLREQGVTSFLELGPDCVLSAMARTA